MNSWISSGETFFFVQQILKVAQIVLSPVLFVVKMKKKIYYIINQCLYMYLHGVLSLCREIQSSTGIDFPLESGIYSNVGNPWLEPPDVTMVIDSMGTENTCGLPSLP